MVTGPVDLRKALLRNPDQFVQTLATKMMTYAMGRPMEWHDMPTIRAIVSKTAAGDYRFSRRVAPVAGRVVPEPCRVERRVAGQVEQARAGRCRLRRPLHRGPRTEETALEAIGRRAASD